MKTYMVTYKREVLTELEFEVEAESEQEAQALAQEEFEAMDWDYINEREDPWYQDTIVNLDQVPD